MTLPNKLAKPSVQRSVAMLLSANFVDYDGLRILFFNKLASVLQRLVNESKS